MKRTVLMLLLVEENDEPEPVEVSGAEIEELSRVVRARPKRTLAKCGDILELLPKAAGGGK
jgi:hypothetical protein